jgi:hypothetical protein
MLRAGLATPRQEIRIIRREIDGLRQRGALALTRKTDGRLRTVGVAWPTCQE